MNLTKKKELAAKALKVGKNRVRFDSERLNEIKEAITKEDVKGLVAEGVISIKPVKGRKKVEKRKTRRGPGKIKKKVNKRKQVYVKITRKLRAYIIGLRDKRVIESDLYWDLRKKIRMRDFKSLSSMKDYLRGVGVEIPGGEVEKAGSGKRKAKRAEKFGKSGEKKDVKAGGNVKDKKDDKSKIKDKNKLKDKKKK
jgi:large subunit ribosomal protein L19e